MSSLSMACSLRGHLVSPDQCESWAGILERAGFQVRVEELSEKNAKGGLRSAGYVIRGREKVNIFVVEPTPQERKRLRQCGVVLEDRALIMGVFPYKISFWPWGARSDNLAAAIEKALSGSDKGTSLGK